MMRGIEILKSYREQVQELQPDHPDLKKLDALIAHGQTLINRQAPVEFLAQVADNADFIKSLGPAPEQVAQHPDQITKDTKAYVGSLVHYDNQGKIIPIFQRLHGVEIYTSPERKIRRETLKIDGRLSSPDQALEELKQAGINKTDYAEDMVRKTPFTGNPRDVELVWLNGFDVGLTEVTTTTNRFGRGEGLGLEKCDQEVGIYQRLTDKAQLLNTWYYIVMETITGRSGDPGVFGLEHDVGGIWLGGTWAMPGNGWDPGSQLVFALPQR